MKLYHELEIIERIEGMTSERLRCLLARGWVASEARDESGARLFEDIDAARIRLIQELEQGMGVNEEGIEIILDLLDQLHGLRRRTRRLIEAIETLDPVLRRKIARAIEAKTR